MENILKIKKQMTIVLLDKFNINNNIRIIGIPKIKGTNLVKKHESKV